VILNVAPNSATAPVELRFEEPIDRASRRCVWQRHAPSGPCLGTEIPARRLGPMVCFVLTLGAGAHMTLSAHLLLRLPAM
jgi:hypothetical protein